MHLKSFIYGIVAGALLAVVLFFMFRDRMADTTSDVGRKVERAGESLKKTGDELR